MAEQLFQIGIKGLIRDKEGRILMVYIPQWGRNAAHWDLPGGRMDPGETFLETLQRELHEEIGIGYVGDPRQLTAMLTNIMIPVDGVPTPLAFVIYEVSLPTGARITLDPDSAEESYDWFAPKQAADNMAHKFSPEFCDFVRSL